MGRRKYLQIFIGLAALIFLFCLLQRFQVVVDVLLFILKVFSPILLGFIVAFVLNLPMRGLERLWDRLSCLFQKRKKEKKKKNQAIQVKKRLNERLRRPICLLLSIVIILFTLSFLIALVIPEIVKAVVLIVNQAPGYFEQVRDMALKYVDRYPLVRDFLLNLQIDWDAVAKTILGVIGSGTLGVVSGTFGYIINTLGGIFDFIVALIFAIYVLLSKEKLQTQVSALLQAFLPKKAQEVVLHVSQTAHRIFSSFVAGQCVEAVILGSLCVFGMLIFRFPYAVMIGSLVGATALIPVVGAFIGAGVGAFLILMQDPFQALMFILFIVILQQIEGNVIYPKVVGTSVGLPAMWVLAAVVVGGGIGGIAGMLFAVPTVSVLYTLLREYTGKRISKKEETEKAVPPEEQGMKRG